jgi:hypothetical protein
MLFITKKLNLFIKEKIMVTKQTTLQAFRKSLLVTLALITLLAACAPAQPSQGQVQSLVQTSVASTMQAQNQVGTFVAQTVQAYQPAATETQQPIATDTPTVETTETPLLTLTPILLETPTTAPSSGGGGGGYVYVPPQPYHCDPDIDKRPLDGTTIAAGDHFEIKWTIKNDGTQDWAAGFYIDWHSVQLAGVGVQPSSPPQISTITGPIYLPAVKSGYTFTIPTMEGIAPTRAGNWVLTWKLHGISGCFPYIAITVT